MTIVRYFCLSPFSTNKEQDILNKLRCLNDNVETLCIEACYHVETQDSLNFDKNEETKLIWLLSSPFKPGSLKKSTHFSHIESHQAVIECGPRFNFSTADSSNAVQICQTVGLKTIMRLEKSYRYFITFANRYVLSEEMKNELSGLLYDRMTHCVYTQETLPSHSFNESLGKNVEPWYIVPLLQNGKKALKDVNEKLGLAFDSWDINYYSDLFQKQLKRNPTSVECFDLAQSNSEHSRHWFFKGKLFLNGKEYEKSLIEVIMDTQETSNKNNIIKFSDNSSAIEGFEHKKLFPVCVTGPCKVIAKPTNSDIIFTAETHNMPTAVAPFSGATTGTGGRIRDVQAVGRGGHTVAGTAGYCVGCLKIPGFDLPWEDNDWEYPYNFSSPLEILIEASNGASDYGNKFGEPVIGGFVLSYGLLSAEKIRSEYVKPVMFSGGIGYMSHDMAQKARPEKDMLIVKLGGPVYRIGVGGGAASSVAVQGDSSRSAALDFGAVQRGDAEMGNRLNRAIRACIENSYNPIQAIHDQGAGGNGNVLKELVEPNGAVIFTKEFSLGDPTITTMELWGAEYQESNAVLCKSHDRELLNSICSRERCPISFVGKVINDGTVKLIEDKMENLESHNSCKENIPFDLNLEAVLGKIPRKVFNLTYKETLTTPFIIPLDVSVLDALQRVFRIVSVGSKRYLINKVDRCVTGLVAQQQCVGPLHTPLADFAMIALSYFDTVGAATSIGTQPLKGVTNPEVGARMSVGEALTNLVFAGITCLPDVKCSGNWMWGGKTGDEGGKLAIACYAMCNIMSELGIAVDGGKDSLSMSAGIRGNQVKSPGTLVVSTYAPCPDITIKVEPNLKQSGSIILWIPLNPCKHRMGGSALAQSFKQQGSECPDVDNVLALKNLFNATQKLIKEHKILAGHDVSDGGVITCILEMAFAGLRGLDIDIHSNEKCLEVLFSEELGLVLEIHPSNLDYCTEVFNSFNLNYLLVGHTGEYGMDAPISIKFNNNIVLNSKLYELLSMWEEISYRLELLQANSECIEEEWRGLKTRIGPQYKITFDPELILNKSVSVVNVAVIREEGINGDREMIASLIRAQFDVYDITMHDLINGSITLDKFQGIVFPGGFSYADTLGSAKGWAGSILFNKILRLQFHHFAFSRNNTFSLGVCNGCQLMALLGWIGTLQNYEIDNIVPEIVLNHNRSERFECRWPCVKINSGKGTRVWLKEMNDSVLGVWIAHGEGRFSFKHPEILNHLRKNEQICLQYVDDNSCPTEVYPMNPNGSPIGIAGVCSSDGRHLAIMPHPERCTLTWQCPVSILPDNHLSTNLLSPWQKMFNNAYIWATENQ